MESETQTQGNLDEQTPLAIVLREVAEESLSADQGGGQIRSPAEGGLEALHISMDDLEMDVSDLLSPQVRMTANRIPHSRLESVNHSRTMIRNDTMHLKYGGDEKINVEWDSVTGMETPLADRSHALMKDIETRDRGATL